METPATRSTRRQARHALAGCLALLTVATSSLLAAGAPPAKRRPRASRITPVVEAYRRAAPAVVNISTITPVETGLRMFGGGDDPFREFMPRLLRRTVPVTSLGSGFLIHADGYLVTNAHVVRRARKITVTLADKSSFEADVVAANSAHDLAVLKVRDAGSRTFHFLRLGRSDDLLVGETVIVIGNPFGYQNTCTTGVLSALSRKIELRPGVVHDRLIQIDAAVNPGNSGGPLLNVNGELIGINTAIRSDAEGIGFAIPVGLLADDLPRLLDFERLNRVVFGLTVARRHTPAGKRLVVASVAPGSPAAEAGCRVGDCVLALNGKPLKHLPHFQIAMLGIDPGATARLRCLRAGKTVRFDVTVKARPKPDGGALAEGLFGLHLKALTEELARRLRLPVEAGLLVTRVEQGSPADELGIRRGDVVFQLGRWYVTDLDRVGAILEDVEPGGTLRVGIIRGRVRAWASLKARKPRAPSSRPKFRL